MSQINQYPNEAFVINDEDFYDVDYWTGSAFESRKISGATLKSVLSALATNLYNSDGTLTGNRTVDLDGFQLSLGDATGSAVFNGQRLILNGNSTDAGIQLQAADTQAKQILFQSNNLDRFKITVRNFEAGGDSGSGFFIELYDDAGVVKALPISIYRDTEAVVISNVYSLPTADGTPGQVLTTDGLGTATWQPVSGIGAGNINTASSQWSKTLPAPVALPDGQVANGFTFFDNVADKLANGTTPYYEFDIDYGITITLSGTSGTANINVNGVNYLATYTASLFQTAVNWVTTNQAALNALGIVVFALGSGADGRIRFGSPNQALLNAISITNVTTNLSGTLANEFTGLPTAAGDHVRIPYVGTPIDTQRLLHTIRANFNIQVGSVQYAELRLYRYQNDTVIGSGVTIQRNPDETGQQVVIETYTGGALDPFVVGGFYIGLANNTGTTLTFESSAGILIQTIFQKPTLF